ncbi:MAG: flippase-like domain-containing protein, partial [Ignavibacteriaceae bacterium]|nr:flippase-like domain-containing protein [Ignavibacteriaceae bacterium]
INYFQTQNYRFLLPREENRRFINIVKEFIVKNSKLLRNLLKLVIAAGLIVFIVAYIKPSEIIETIITADPFLIFLVILILPVNLFFQYNRWRIACRELLGVTDRRKVITSLFYGYSAGAFTPMRVGEYFGRSMAFKDKTLLNITIATVADKIFPLLIVFYAGTFSLLLFLQFRYNLVLYVSLPILAVILISFYFTIMLFLDADFWNNILFKKLKSFPRFYKLLQRFSVLKSLKKNVSAKMTLISIGQYISFILQFALLAAAFSAKYNLINFIWAGCLLMFAKTVIPPVTIGELGIREGASVFFVTQLGGTAAAAFNASIFLFIINILIPSALGMLLLLKNRDD